MKFDEKLGKIAESNAFKNVLGITALAIGLCAMLAMLYAYEHEKVKRELSGESSQQVQHQNGKFQAGDFCPLEEKDGDNFTRASKSVKLLKVIPVTEITAPEIPRKTAIIVDATDRLPSDAAGMLASQFALRAGAGGNSSQSNLEDYEMVAIHELRDSIVAMPEPSFRKCAPIHNNISEWTDNKRQRLQTFKNQFERKIKEQVYALIEQPESDRSPIMETLGEIAKSYDRIIIVSDMMEHASASCSLYTRGIAKHDYESFKRKGCANYYNSLAGKDIQVLLVLREKIRHLQNPTLKAMWENHFKRHGAKHNFTVLGDIPPACKDSPDKTTCSVCLAPGFIEGYSTCPAAIK